MTKKRTLNELRQSKPFGYRPPNSYFVEDVPNFDNRHIQDLIKKFPNDYDLGREIRKYYIELTHTS